MDDAGRVRHARQLTPFTLTAAEQEALASARVAVVGAGGLGSPVLTYLACAGVGHLTVVDGDVVEESNLNRQFLHGTDDVGTSKAENARTRLLALDPALDVRVVDRRLTAASADRDLAADVVVDATDNHATRQLIAGWAAREGTPCVWGAVFGAAGFVSTFDGRRGQTYDDVFGDGGDGFAPPPPSVSGALGAVCGAIGSVMALEVVKVVVRRGDLLTDRLLRLDGWTADVRVLALAPTRA